MSRAPLAAAVIAALAAGFAFNVHAAAPAPQGQAASQSSNDQSSSSKDQDKSKKTQKLQRIVVTGSLIPQTEIETATPVTTITAADIKAKGFATVAEALQATSFATGSVQGQSTSNSFTQGASTISLFGLPPGFVKYLINGRPMGNFPALYNGSDVFNNIDGIPADLVDHIDILPGGQSSLYGSDAIAGVINIVLKDHLSAPTIDARYGWYTKGGGVSKRLSAADTFHWGKFNLLAGVQWDSNDPIWGYQRNITSHAFLTGRTSASAAFNEVEYSLTGNALYLFDPNKCSNVKGLWGGSEQMVTIPASRGGYYGSYCGSFRDAGFKTLASQQRTADGYLHATYDVNPNLQLYGDLLYKYADTRYNGGSNTMFWGSGSYVGPFYDPNANDFVALQKVWAPEEMGGVNASNNKQYDSSIFLNVGANGTFGDSDWDYDVGVTHSEEHLDERMFTRFKSQVEAFYAKILGPQQGYDPYYNYYPVYTPDYSAFYSPITPDQYRSFTGYVTNRSKTWDNLLRAQVTDSSLFTLPGGDAGLAVVVEGGNSGWDYSPDPKFLAGDVWGNSTIQGAGHRSRYALTSELRLPIIKQLTLDLSARRDEFNNAGNKIGKTTYMAGIEFRPIESLLFRGRYGTAFKAPSLSDLFQGQSQYYNYVPDYYQCYLAGFDPSQINQCPLRLSNVQFQGTQEGNTKLQPINAKVWTYGVVWAPTSKLNFSVDYYHTSINNEVTQESASGLTLTDYQCRTGILDSASPTCQAAFNQITRNALGTIVAIDTPKINVSNELTNSIIAHASWRTSLGRFGDLTLQGSYTDMLKHTQQTYPGDPQIDLLRHPGYSTDFKTKANATASWSKNKWSATLYVDRYGKSPNYYATVQDSYANPLANTLAPWIVYNASVRYQVTSALKLSFMVNNLFNAMPPADHSYSGSSGSPYDAYNYNVFGRAMYVEANYKFGQ